MSRLKVPIGFSTGCLYKSGIDIFSADLLAYFRSIGCTAIELNALEEKHIDRLESLTREDVEGFAYVSLHGPALGITFTDDAQTRSILDRIVELHKKLTFQSIVIHPDRVQDWNVLDSYLDRIPLSIENMDNRKSVARDISEFNQFALDTRYSIVVDIQHCFTNDPSYNLANDFLETYNERITHVHLSGYDKVHHHWGLFRTRQQELVRQAHRSQKPIIIESRVLCVEELSCELDYVKQLLQ